MSKKEILNTKSNIKKIADFYGKDLQTLQAIQELSELIDRLTQFAIEDHKQDSHQIWVKAGFENLIQEIADVYIMLKQIIYLYKIDSKPLKEATENAFKKTLENMQYVQHIKAKKKFFEQDQKAKKSKTKK